MWVYTSIPHTPSWNVLNYEYLAQGQLYLNLHYLYRNMLNKGGRTPTASRQASRHGTKEAVLLHS
jgi:hypothetical protein